MSDTEYMTEFAERLVEAAKPSKVLDSTSKRFVLRACEASKAFLWQRAKDCIANAENRPILYHYGSDATLILSRARLSLKLDAVSVQRSGGSSEDFLIERAFVQTTNPLGDTELCYLGRDPRPMTKGKTSLEIFSACCQFFPVIEMLRKMPGIVVYHFVFDRAMMSAMSTKLHQRSALYWQDQQSKSSQSSAGADSLGELLSWVVVAGCSLHDVHNALRWGLRAVLTSIVDVNKSLHIVIESLRNSFSMMQKSLASFVCQHLTVDDCDAHNPEPLFQFWVACGLQFEVAERVSLLNLRWQDGELKVAKCAAQSSQNILEEVSWCLVASCRFRSFSDSRWVSMGESRRSLLCCLLLGLDGWVRTTREDPCNSDYYIHGFDQCTDEVRRLVCTAAFASRVCDVVLYELLQDDRLAQRHQEVRRCMHEELSWLEDLPATLWDRCSKLLVHTTSRVLRTDAVNAATVSMAFMQHHIFDLVDEYPWLLCLGDLDANLAGLKDADVPVHDVVTLRVQALVRAGYNTWLLKEGLRRLSGARWSTNFQEQGHASATLLHRNHKLLGNDMMLARAQLRMLRSLITPLLDEEKKHLALARRRQKLALRQGKRITGPHLFFKDVLSLAQDGSEQDPHNNIFLHNQMRAHGRLSIFVLYVDGEYL